jgi:hypothetical protein
MKLAGIIYLHEISQTRMLGTSRKNLTMFRKLCGDDALENVILVTTKWGDNEPSVEVRREQQLSDTFWKDMITKGSKMARFMNTHESAWAIVDQIRTKIPVTALIQQELVELQKILPETEAGRTLRYTLQQLLQAQTDMVQQLQMQQENGTEGNDALQERSEEISKRLRSTVDQIHKLKIPMGRRIMAFLVPLSSKNVCKSFPTPIPYVHRSLGRPEIHVEGVSETDYFVDAWCYYNENI